MVTGQTRLVPVSYGFSQSQTKKRKVYTQNEVPTLVTKVGKVLSVLSEIIQWLLQPAIVDVIARVLAFIRRIFFNV